MISNAVVNPDRTLNNQRLGHHFFWILRLLTFIKYLNWTMTWWYYNTIFGDFEMKKKLQEVWTGDINFFHLDIKADPIYLSSEAG